jgi:hypothetical protein
MFALDLLALAEARTQAFVDGLPEYLDPAHVTAVRAHLDALGLLPQIPDFHGAETTGIPEWPRN